MVWIPVAFVCFFGNHCEFYQGTLSVSEAQCRAQNKGAEIQLKNDSKVEAFMTDCLIISPQPSDSL